MERPIVASTVVSDPLFGHVWRLQYYCETNGGVSQLDRAIELLQQARRRIYPNAPVHGVSGRP